LPLVWAGLPGFGRRRRDEGLLVMTKLK